jgi:hypothetical protein
LMEKLGKMTYYQEWGDWNGEILSKKWAHTAFKAMKRALITLSGFLDPIICKTKGKKRESQFWNTKRTDSDRLHFRITPLSWRCWNQPSTAQSQQSYQQQTFRSSLVQARGIS